MTRRAVGLWAAAAMLLLAVVPGPTRLIGRVHDALVGYFTAHAAARSPVPDEMPSTVRGFRTPRQVVTTAPPVRLRIPAIGVDTPLDHLDLAADGAIEEPPQWHRAGWYRRGPKPGQPGPAVILGHVDSTTGPAVFARLDELDAGDRIVIDRKDGTTVEFTVQRLAPYPKAEFPTGEVYLPTPEPVLRLITCTGVFDRAAGSYRDNLVVFAELTG